VGCASHAPDAALQAFDAARIEAVFNACFHSSYRTRLIGGAGEPFYRPANAPTACHLLHYRADFFASALHETAHWCIAGARRRAQPDFGYWYVAGNRDADQQRAFEAAECRPQALEWIFSIACGYRFRPSADNLDPDGDRVDTTHFNRGILAQALAWQARGLGARADRFYRALCDEFGTGASLRSLRFTLDDLE